jgi:hypothetical protein
MPRDAQQTDHAVIHLDEDRAIVLFEYPSERPSDDEATAECAVLNFVLGQLEKQLVAPFREDYADLLSAARTRLTPSA